MVYHSTLMKQQENLKQQFDLLYIFDPNDVGFSAEGARLVDEKVLYYKICDNRETDTDVMLYKQAVPNEALYRLALISGEYSRFRLDRQLPNGSYEHLYRKWIEGACPQEGINKQIFLYAPDGIAQGMITVDFSGNHAHIGLVAVDPEFQYQGFGTKIMSSLEGFLYKQGVEIIEVATQRANIKACKWYEKNGFRVKSITPIYHWWLNKN